MTPAEWKDIIHETAPFLAGLAGVLAAVATLWSKLVEGQRLNRADLEADYKRELEKNALLQERNDELEKENRELHIYKMKFEDCQQNDLVRISRDTRLAALGITAGDALAWFEQEPSGAAAVEKIKLFAAVLRKGQRA